MTGSQFLTGASDPHTWTFLALVLGLWGWGALPVSRWIKNPFVLATLQLLRGAIAVGSVLAFYTDAGNVAWHWGAGVWTAWSQVSSPFYRTADERPRGFFLSAGALAVLAPWAALSGLVFAAGAYVAQSDGHERKRMELAGIAGAALGGVIAYRMDLHFVVGGLWFLMLLQRQSQNIEVLIAAQKQTRGSLR